MSCRVLISGVFGFIASHFAKHVLRVCPDAQVVGFGRNSDQANRGRLQTECGSMEEHHRDRFKIIYGDLCDANALSGLCEGVDIVVHFAAKTFVDHAILHEDPFHESNATGTLRLLQDAKRNKVKRFLLVSTDEVLGQILTGSHNENAPACPRNFYAASKLAAEGYAMAFWHTHKLPTIITRTENNFGAFQSRQKALPTFVRAALAGEPLPVYGDGLHVRCWLHVEEHCRAIWHLIQKSLADPQGFLGEVFHVAGEQELTNIELARLVLRTLGKSEDQIKYIPDHNIRPGHDRRYALDCSKLRSTGFSITQDLEERLVEVIHWYEDNWSWTR